MGLLTFVLSLVTVWLLSIAISRPLALDFSLTRRLGAGLLASVISAPIITGITPPEVQASGRNFPAFWYLLLGAVAAVVAAMVLLVVVEVLVPSGSLPGPVAIARELPRRARRTSRYLRISGILFRHGLGAYVFTRQRPDLSTEHGRRRLARSLAAALDDAGVTFVKLGQILATRPDVLPTEFVEELGRLQTAARPVPWEDVRAVVAAELGDAVPEIDAEPLAAASIAQVHTGRLADGRAVVVKVQRPGIRHVVAGDLDILGRIARRLERSTRWGASLGVAALAEGFAASLREELDFRTEARNIAAVAAGGSVRVPGVESALTTRRVLVMERLDGCALTAAAEPVRVASALLEAVLTQVLVHGVFHADPHPGNLLLLERDRIGMLDLGSVGRLDARLRDGLARLLMALDRDDPVGVTDVLLELVDAPAALDEAALQRALGRFLARHLGPGAALDAAMIGELFALIARHGLTAPPELAAVLRAIGTLEGTLTALDPAFDVVGAAREFASRQVAARLEPAAVRRVLTDEVGALLPLLRRLPRRVDRIATALDSGTLTVRVATPATGLTAAALSTLLVTAIAAATGVMAALLLASTGGPAISASMTANQLVGWFLLLVSAILGLRVLAQVYRHRGGP